MKLTKTREQPQIVGFPKSHREWWDIGEGYEIYVDIDEDSCCIGIREKNIRNITYEVAKYLGVDTRLENISFGSKKDSELYLSQSLDCVSLNYMHPEKYKDLLLKIEAIVNKHFKKEHRNKL